jgi:hypothetical protein
VEGLEGDGMSDETETLTSALEREPHVDDAGFTDRVMHALPPPRRRRSLGDALVAGGAAVGWGAVAITIAFAHPRAAPFALGGLLTMAALVLLAAWQTIASIVSIVSIGD